MPTPTTAASRRSATSRRRPKQIGADRMRRLLFLFLTVGGIGPGPPEIDGRFIDIPPRPRLPHCRRRRRFAVPGVPRDEQTLSSPSPRRAAPPRPRNRSGVARVRRKHPRRRPLPAATRRARFRCPRPLPRCADHAYCSRVSLTSPSRPLPRPFLPSSPLSPRVFPPSPCSNSADRK